MTVIYGTCSSWSARASWISAARFEASYKIKHISEMLQA